MNAIDTTSFNKTLLYSPNAFSISSRGYAGKRTTLKSIVIHTTNGKRGSSFEAEAKFIYTSNQISAHYLVGKDGRVVQFLDPMWVAYHAGRVFPAYRYYGNPYSIGIECHLTPGEQWTFDQKKSLFDLLRFLTKKYNITLIESHRKIAAPKGRKIDPSEFPDDEFYAFVRRVFNDTNFNKYLCTVNTNLREHASTSAPILRTLPKGTTLRGQECEGEEYRGSNDWIGVEGGGYIWKNLLRVV